MDLKCENGDEEWVFDQVSEAGKEQTHCHTYQSSAFCGHLHVLHFLRTVPNTASAQKQVS